MAQLAVTNRADRWGYNQDLGILFAAHQNQQPCPPNADQLIQTAEARMGRQLPPQFDRLVLDLKAQSWNTLVTNDIPARANPGAIGPEPGPKQPACRASKSAR
jgi:hypothetical protein